MAGRRARMLLVLLVMAGALLPIAVAAAAPEITAPTVDEPTTIVDDPADVGLEGDCGCRPWWYFWLLGAGGVVLLAAFYAAYRSWRGR